MAFVMPEAKAPCKDCTERFIGCHGTCEKYAAFKKARDEFRTEFQKKVNQEKEEVSFLVDAAYRATRNRKMMK